MHSKAFSYVDPSPQTCVDGDDKPLFGKRAAVQCTISVRGWPTEAGSRALQGFTALEDATVVERMRRAGATLAGSTCTGEMGLGLLGDTTSLALRDDHADLALMTDTLGEARMAAASAGLFGFKPSYGRVSRFGLVGLIPSMDCCSILGKKLEDVTAAFRTIEGMDDRDPSMDGGPVASAPFISKVKSITLSGGIVAQSLEALDASEREGFKDALERLQKETGIELREVQWSDFDLFRTIHNVIGSVEASSSCGKFDGVRYGCCVAGTRNWNEMYLQSRGRSFGPLLKAYLFQGAFFQFQRYAAFERACGIRARLVKGMRELLDSVDLLLFPTIRASTRTTAAETVTQVYESFALTLPANVTGQPALTVPGLMPFRSGDLGLQMIGPMGGDELLFEAARRLCPRTEELG